MSLKTIKVNPIFLSSGTGGSGFSVKNKTRKEKPSGVSLGQSNSIKKKLIARIKNFQQNTQKPDSQPAEQHLNDVFGDSVQFLDNLARDKEEEKREKKNKTLKSKQTVNPYMNIATELPPELDWNTITPQAPPPVTVQQPVQQLVSVQQPVSVQQVSVQQVSVQQVAPTQWEASPQPSYSNLKTGGTRPTYRTWLRTTQKQKPIPKQPINILEDTGTPISVTTEPLENNKIINPPDIEPTPTEPILASPIPIMTSPPAPAAAYMPSLKPKRKRITRTLKYKLGKHANGKVSVLIKNSQTRRKVQTEQALLKQKSILDIKNHLRSNNLLKAGSNAPSDVLRHLYEQSILAGQIENKAKDTLIHNYFNDEKNNNLVYK
jgi:hypothetical protein